MGGSTVAWLDTSPDEQHRVREMLKLFSQQESRDELGIGQIRDALSNTLFPGTSVLQTRARYYLFVPWCFTLAAKRTTDPERVRTQADRLERTLAVTLPKTPGVGDGVIGARAGAALKNLPSALFWNGMVQYGILRRDVAPNRLVVRVVGAHADEATDRAAGDWHPTLPPPPPGFPDVVDGGFALTRPEAEWLRERMLDGAAGSLLGRLVAGTRRPDDRSPAAWADSAVAAVVDATTRPALDHAHRFSFALLGATRVYGLLVARAYLDAGFNQATDSTGHYEEALAGWLDDLAAQRHLVDDWDLADLWALVARQNPRLSPRTRDFVEQWVALVRSPTITTALDPAGPAMRLVAARERTLKRGQSRLDNHKLLGMWGGAATSNQLTYRWPQVRQLVTDIHDGLDERATRAGA